MTGIHVARQGIGWSVLKDGHLVQNETSSGVHKTIASAFRQARRVAEASGEHVVVECPRCGQPMSLDERSKPETGTMFMGPDRWHCATPTCGHIEDAD